MPINFNKQFATPLIKMLIGFMAFISHDMGKLQGNIILSGWYAAYVLGEISAKMSTIGVRIIIMINVAISSLKWRCASIVVRADAVKLAKVFIINMMLKTLSGFFSMFFILIEAWHPFLAWCCILYLLTAIRAVSHAEKIAEMIIKVVMVTESVMSILFIGLYRLILIL